MQSYTSLEKPHSQCYFSFVIHNIILNKFLFKIHLYEILISKINMNSHTSAWVVLWNWHHFEGMKMSAKTQDRVIKQWKCDGKSKNEVFALESDSFKLIILMQKCQQTQQWQAHEYLHMLGTFGSMEKINIIKNLLWNYVLQQFWL